MIKYEKKIPSKEELWLHGCARTTETIRRAIQDSKEKSFRNIITLIQKLSLNGENAHLLKILKASKINVLILKKEAVIVAFRKHTLLPLDDCLAVYNSALLACIAVITLVDYQILMVRLKQKRSSNNTL